MITQAPPHIYNFSALTPDVQKYLFTQICAFDIAANNLSNQNDAIIVSVRMGLLMRVYQSLEHDDRLTICHLEAICTQNQLPRYAFNELTPNARWSSLMWVRAVDIAITDLWGCDRRGQFLDEIRTSLLVEAESYTKDCIPEEIALYFAHIDKWQPQAPGYNDIPLLTEAA